MPTALGGDIGFLYRQNQKCMIHREIGVATRRGGWLEKMAKSTTVAGDPSQLLALQNSGLPMRRACIEFEPQNLGIVSIDSGGKIIEANEAFLSMSGYSLADLPLDMATITPAEWHELDDSMGRRFADNGHCLPWQKQILTRQGDLLPIVIGAAALNPTANRFQYFIVET